MGSFDSVLILGGGVMVFLGCVWVRKASNGLELLKRLFGRTKGGEIDSDFRT